MNFCFLPSTQLSKSTLSHDGTFAGIVSPGQTAAIYKVSPPLALRLALAEECSFATRALAFRMTLQGTSHAALIRRQPESIVFVNLSDGSKAGEIEIDGARCLAFAVDGNALLVGTESGGIARFDLAEEEHGLVVTGAFLAAEEEASAIHRLSVNPFGAPGILMLCDQGNLVFEAGGSRFDILSPDDRPWRLGDFACGGETHKRVYLRRNGDLLVSSPRGESLIQIQLEAAPGIFKGVAASNEFEAIVFSRHEVFGLRLETDEDATSSRFELVRLGFHEREITNVAEDPLSGRLTAIYE
jgi:hypothetical protein